VHIFIISRRRPGRFGWLQSQGLLALTVALLALLQDDDVKAFPHMRFNPKTLVAEDSSVARLIRFIESLPVSDWSRASKSVAAGAFSSANHGQRGDERSEELGEARP
jgi:hypothetical protein